MARLGDLRSDNLHSRLPGQYENPKESFGWTGRCPRRVIHGLRHSFISYRVAETQDVAKVALEAGNSPQIIFQHYR